VAIPFHWAIERPGQPSRARSPQREVVAKGSGRSLRRGRKASLPAQHRRPFCTSEPCRVSPVGSRVERSPPPRTIVRRRVDGPHFCSRTGELPTLGGRPMHAASHRNDKQNVYPSVEAFDGLRGSTALQGEHTRSCQVDFRPGCARQHPPARITGPSTKLQPACNVGAVTQLRTGRASHVSKPVVPPKLGPTEQDLVPCRRHHSVTGKVPPLRCPRPAAI
jgi:hypothetical protein